MKFVLDASLSLAWCFRDEGSRFSEAVLQALPRLGAAVPSLWAYEVANALRDALKSGRIDEAAALEFMDSLDDLPIETVLTAPRTVLVEVRLLALQHSLSAYDPAYLALALDLEVLLRTLDGTGKRMGLKKAAAEVGVVLVSKSMIGSWVEATE